jgi:hypothetical protein
MLTVHSHGRAYGDEEMVERKSNQSDRSQAAAFATGGFTTLDPAVEDLHASAVLRLVQVGVLRGASAPTAHTIYVGETPVEGAGARALACTL